MQEVDIISTDHCYDTKENKNTETKTFTKIKRLPLSPYIHKLQPLKREPLELVKLLKQKTNLLLSNLQTATIADISPRNGNKYYGTFRQAIIYIQIFFSD